MLYAFRRVEPHLQPEFRILSISAGAESNVSLASFFFKDWKVHEPNMKKKANKVSKECNWHISWYAILASVPEKNLSNRQKKAAPIVKKQPVILHCHPLHRCCLSWARWHNCTDNGGISHHNKAASPESVPS
jgi:hypothetical protein